MPKAELVSGKYFWFGAVLTTVEPATLDADDRYRKAGSRKKEGTGLGLAIVKKILEMHQTEIHVRSAVNQGSAFWFSLPVVE